MPEADVQLLHDYFEAANRREFDVVMAMYADDVELVIPEGWIMAGVHAGKRAVGRFFGDWYRTFDGGPHFDVVQTKDCGEAVALHARGTARGGISGVELSDDYFYVFRVRHGQIVHVQFYGAWDDAVAAAGC